MKTRKTIHEVSNTINTNQLDATNLDLFKIFSLPIWAAVVVSISLGFISKPVRAGNAGTEDVHRNYRYIKPIGVENTAGSASQGTKESSAAKDTEAKKTNPGEQAKSPNENASAATSNLSTKESSAAKDTGAKKTNPGEQAKSPNENASAATSNLSTKESSAAKDTGAKKTNPGEQAKSPNENASAASTNLSTKESSTEKCAGAEKTTSGAQKTTSGGNYGSAGNVGQESKESSTATAKESGGQAPTSGNQTTNTDQNTQQTPLAKDTKAENSTSGDQNSQSDRKIDPVSKAAEGEKAFPAFDQADKNGDHYVTKDELKDYPSLLEVFDKVDAGKDGKLEQHEYQNLEMETKREGGIR